MTTSGDEEPQRTLAAKINRLFEVVHPPTRGPYSDKEVEEWLQDNPGGPTISANYLRWLRRGERENPSVDHLRAVARFFGINPGYLLSNDDSSTAVATDLETLALFRSSGVRAIAARAVRMNDQEQAWWARMMDERPESGPTRRRRRRPTPPNSASPDDPGD